jgi:PhnB protein
MAGTKLNPYIALNGNAREAMEFYHGIFGGDIKFSTFGEFNMPGTPDDYKDKIMHAVIEAKDITLMASDGQPGGKVNFGDNVSLSLSGEDEAELTGYFNQLADGGKTTMPLEKQVWGDTFGMCTDKFGFHWMVNINQASAGQGDTDGAGK